MPANIPEDLRRCLTAQYDRFDGLFDRAVPIDLTPPSDGFEEQDFGGPRLKAAVLDLLPKAYRQTLLQMDQLREALLEIQQERSLPIILAHSVLAASAAAVPIPWIDLPVVMAIQSHLAHRSGPRQSAAPRRGRAGPCHGGNGWTIGDADGPA